MSTTTISDSPLLLRDPDFKAQLKELRRTDNLTNWFYLGRTYGLLAIVAGSAVWFYHFQAANGLSVLWNIPVTVLAIALVGALQHHLANLTHESVHHVLFKNRILNDIGSELLCSFPMFSSTFHYGLHHLAHHQFVNDPLRDPDISQLEMSGHRLDFPVDRQEFFKVLLRQLWPLNLMRYSLARAEYDSLGTDKNPYVRKGWKPSKLPRGIWTLYLVALVGLLTGLVIYGNSVLLAVVPSVFWLAVMLALWLLPDRHYYQSRIQPLVSVRMQGMMRTTFLTLVFCGLAWGTLLTGHWWGLYFLLLWIVPLLTSFSFFMILRQVVQHGNADRGWLTNTRVFFCGPMFNFAVFPMGQDYHLPHHMFATVPHYRLKKLHEVLMQYEEYRDQATVVEGYMTAKEQPQTRPTVVEVLGPDHAPKVQRDVYIDNTIFDQHDVAEEDRNFLLKEGEEEIQRARRDQMV